MGDEITKTGDGALAKSSLAEQYAELERRRDEQVAAREARSQGGVPSANSTGTTVAMQRYNAVALAEVPALEKRSHEMRLAHAKRSPTPKGQYKMHYRCTSCGWDATLEFDPHDPEDAEKLEQCSYELSYYTGPCPSCKFRMLVPHDAIFHETIAEQEEAKVAAHVNVVTNAALDTILERGGNVLMGAAAKAAAVAGVGQPGDDGYEEDEPAGELTDGE